MCKHTRTARCLTYARVSATLFVFTGETKEMRVSSLTLRVNAQSVQFYFAFI